MKTKLTALIATLCLIPTAYAEGNFLNLGSVPAHIDGQLANSIDKPYREFAQDWMKGSKIAGLARIISGDFMPGGPINRRFYTRDMAQYESMTTKAVPTFKAYCDHHQGESVILSSEAFCVKNNIPIAYMDWGRAGDGYAEFVLDDGIRAEGYYRTKVLEIQPGKTIVTAYGPAIIIEKGQNSMIRVQPQRRGETERWITTDEVYAR